MTSLKKDKNRKLIPTVQAKPVQLAKSYGSPADYFRGSVNAYTGAGHARKEAFLRDGRLFMRAVGSTLRESGFTEMSVRVNPAGMAVGGDVYADYFHPDYERWVFLTLTSSVIRGDRTDGVVLYGRWRGPAPERRGVSTPEGPNVWASANWSSVKVAQHYAGVVVGREWEVAA